MLKLCTAAILSVFVTTGAATAQSVTAAYPGSVIDALSTLGHSPELTTDNSGDPMINAQTDGLYYSVLFYGCEYNVNCKDIQVRATFTVDGSFDTGLLASYNKDWFIGKTYMSYDSNNNLIACVIGLTLI